ncbi:hypothetical protein M0638_07500 [Roseomonas sp. NAR14]|uniref:Uncharacterized protein n=1 Tax=Roseomonas acroporae TaxID=2937791 RepID=A0A9X1Y650_9PROT|nr:hypothetical protein [Roseomonas acroporae]MCK8784221.1 hypothetical protein [Roseomonas acroporae]
MRQIPTAALLFGLAALPALAQPAVTGDSRPLPPPLPYADRPADPPTVGERVGRFIDRTWNETRDLTGRGLGAVGGAFSRAGDAISRDGRSVREDAARDAAGGR